MLRHKMAPMDDKHEREPLLTARQVAQHLQISDRKLGLMVSLGEAPPHFKIGRLRRWRPEVVDAWLKARAEGSTFDHTNKEDNSTTEK